MIPSSDLHEPTIRNNPFARLARLASDIYQFELARYTALGPLMRSLPGREDVMEKLLIEAVREAVTAWRQSGWPAREVHERTSKLVNDCRRLMAWATLRGDWPALSDAALSSLSEVEGMALACEPQAVQVQAAVGGEMGRDCDRPPGAVDPLPQLLSAGELAKRLECGRKSMESFLTRHANKHPDCRTEVDTRRRNEPAYLYRVESVWPALVQWKNAKSKHG